MRNKYFYMWKSVLNKKVLVEHTTNHTTFEAVVRSISDQGSHIQLETCGQVQWIKADEYRVVDTVQLNERVLLNEVVTHS